MSAEAVNQTEWEVVDESTVHRISLRPKKNSYGHILRYDGQITLRGFTAEFQISEELYHDPAARKVFLEHTIKEIKERYKERIQPWYDGYLDDVGHPFRNQVNEDSIILPPSDPRAFLETN